VFVFGVGNDVNTQLLDTLAAKTSGTRDYVRPSEDIEVKMSALFEKLAHPVMRDVKLEVDGIQWSRLAPNKLGDMFRGSHIVVVGRYAGHGDVAVRLTGKVGDSDKEFVFDAKFPEVAKDHDFIATIWAQRRVGQLLDAIRLNGQNPELVAEIRRIGKEHGIVTPYTSHLIIEEGNRVSQLMGRPPAPTGGGVRPWNGRPGRTNPGGPTTPGAGGRRGPTTGGVGLDTQTVDSRVRADLERAGKKLPKAAEGKSIATRPPETSADSFIMGRGKRPKTSGREAVKVSRDAARLQFLASVDDNKSGSLWRTQRIRDRQFHLVAGVWIDGGYKKALEKHLRKIEAFSSEYFELLKKHPELAPYLAFSTSILIVLGENEAVEITPAAPSPTKDTEKKAKSAPKPDKSKDDKGAKK